MLLRIPHARVETRRRSIRWCACVERFVAVSVRSVYEVNIDARENMTLVIRSDRLSSRPATEINTVDSVKSRLQ